MTCSKHGIDELYRRYQFEEWTCDDIMINRFHRVSSRTDHILTVYSASRSRGGLLPIFVDHDRGSRIVIEDTFQSQIQGEAWSTIAHALTPEDPTHPAVAYCGISPAVSKYFHDLTPNLTSSRYFTENAIERRLKSINLNRSMRLIMGHRSSKKFCTSQISPSSRPSSRLQHQREYCFAEKATRVPSTLTPVKEWLPPPCQ